MRGLNLLSLPYLLQAIGLPGKFQREKRSHHIPIAPDWHVPSLWKSRIPPRWPVKSWLRIVAADRSRLHPLPRHLHPDRAEGVVCPVVRGLVGDAVLRPEIALDLAVGAFELGGAVHDEAPAARLPAHPGELLPCLSAPACRQRQADR